MTLRLLLDDKKKTMKTRLPARLLALSLLLLSVWGLEIALPTGELRDYGSFVASGRAATAGENPYGIYPLTFHVVLPGIDVWNPNLNPPVSLPLFQLFDTFDPVRGFRLWWSLSFWAYLCAVALLVRRYGAGLSWLLAFWAIALAGFWDTLALGQIYLPLVLAAVGAWLLMERGRVVLAGVLIGLVVAVKPNFAVWPVLLLLARHYRVSIAAALTASVLMAATLVTHGAEVYRQWLMLIVTDSNRAAFLTNVSVPGLAQRMDAGTAGAIVSLALLLGLCGWAVRHQPPMLRASALGILGGILASPIAWIHYTLFLLPVFFTTRMSAPMIAAAALLVVPVPVVLQFLDAPLWMQVTVGSTYNWAVLLCLAGQLLGWRPRYAAVAAGRPPAAVAEGVLAHAHEQGR